MEISTTNERGTLKTVKVYCTVKMKSIQLRAFILNLSFSPSFFCYSVNSTLQKVILGIIKIKEPQQFSFFKILVFFYYNSISSRVFSHTQKNAFYVYDFK